MQVDFVSSGRFANLQLNYRADTSIITEDLAKSWKRWPKPPACSS
jgi:hypothetical protein